MSEDLKSKVIDTIDSLIPKGQNSLSLREADMAYGIYKAKEAVEKLFAEISTQDCISRQAAIDAIDEIESEVADGDGFQYEKWKQYFCDLPSADIDLSDYSDRLWRNAYERGKAVSKDALDEAYAHGYTAAEADFHKKNQWIPVAERLPEIDMSHPHHEDYLVQYDSGGMDVASWSNVNRFWTDHVTEPYWNCVQFAKVVAYMPLPEPWKGEDDA